MRPALRLAVPTLVLFSQPLAAQSQASLAVGFGTVRFTGASSFATAALAPAAQYLTPTLFAGGSATLALLDDGSGVAQGRADVWAASGATAGRAHLAVGGSAGAIERSDGASTGLVQGVVEAIWIEQRWGVGLGVGGARGTIGGEPPVSAARLRVRAWRQVAPLSYSLSVEPQHFLGAWFTDILAGATFDRGRVVASLWTAARVSETYPSTATGSAFVQYYLRPTLALEAGAGGYLREPYQGLPRGGFVTVGLRLHAVPRALHPPPVPAAPPLIPERRGDSLVVRFHMPGARALAIAGNWNGWRPIALRALGEDVWEGTLVLAPGSYQFNLRVDEREWVVPGGVAVVSDGMGGLVAILLVP